MRRRRDQLERRMPRMRLAVSALLLLALVAGLVAIVASATSTSSGDPQPPAPARPAGAPASAKRSTGAPLARTPSAGAVARAVLDSPNQAIDRVLSHTPFVRAGIPKSRVIALTFDDGPGPYTPQVVRVLARMHAPATFFIVGQQLRYFSAGLRDEIRSGFAIGDHTENHPPLSALAPRRQYFQIHADALQLSGLGASFPRLFRPPYGEYNAHTFAILRRLHMLMVLWSVDPRDWLRPGAAAIVRRVLRSARAGAIVELHDGGGNRTETVAALAAIISGLRRRHYQLVTVPQLLAADPPPRHQQLPHLSE